MENLLFVIGLAILLLALGYLAKKAFP